MRQPSLRLLDLTLMIPVLMSPYCLCRIEEENIRQAMQDANLREQAQADRQRIRQVLPSLHARFVDMSATCLVAHVLVYMLLVCTHACFNT